MKKKELLFPEYEPKRQNRFILEFPKALGIEPYLVKKCDRPKYHLNQITGNGEWDIMNIVFHDIIPLSTSDMLIKTIAMKTFTFTISMLDPTGVVVEKWGINVKEIVDVDFGSLDYGSEELLTSILSIKPAKCVLIK